jgi:hypothetical protein
MPRRHARAVVFAVLTLTACIQSANIPDTGARRDVPRNPRWTATLTSLDSTERISGSAEMVPGTEGGGMRVSVAVINAKPGSSLSWQVRRGRCGTDEGGLLPVAAYDLLEIGPDGRGTSGATVPGNTPVSGQYFVSVSASVADRQTIVACGNLSTGAP